ncbi:MAG: hypothetical protein WD314_00020 [Trueperaceae bacterium]
MGKQSGNNVGVEDEARLGSPPLSVELNAVIVSVDRDMPQVLCIGRDRGRAGGALPSGPLESTKERTLELAVRSWVREQAGLELGYVEQLYTFGDRYRDSREREAGERVISISYLALVRQGRLSAGTKAQWRSWYTFFPWEDLRRDRPRVIDEVVVPRLEEWVASASTKVLRQSRLERAVINFGLRGGQWDEERVLERYELLYELGVIAESSEEVRGREPGERFGEAMTSDNRRILATAIGRLRGKLKYRPVVFELLPPSFTLTQLQRLVEALAGRRLHKQNFRRLVEKGGLVEGTGSYDAQTGGRPAERFRFRQAVLRERPAPGLGLPGLRSDGNVRG